MPAATVVAHVAVVAIWAACAAVAAGVGFLVQRLFSGARPARIGGYAATWTGIGAIVLFLQSWHFAFPVDGRALIAIVLAGVAGLALRLRTGALRPTRLRPQAPALLAAGVFLATALWLADRSLAVFAAYDSEMYLVPGVEWAKAFPLVPGLGALHGRFGFNSSSVLLATALEAGPWPPASPHLLNGFFLFLLAARIAGGLRRLERTAPGERSRAVFDALLLAPLVAIAIDDQLLPGLSADVAVAAALFAGASLLLERAFATQEHAAASTLTAAAATLTLAVTFKLSAAAFALAGCVIAFAWLGRDLRAGAVSRRPVALALLFCLGLAGTWLARGVVTTGYPLYPAAVAATAVDWRVPAEQAHAEAAWVARFARTWYAPDLANAPSGSGESWLRPWLVANAAGPDAGLVFLPLLCAIAFGSALLAKREARAVRPLWWPGLAALLSLAFWFLTAPRPSLGLAPAWVLGGIATAGFLGRPGPATALRGVIGVVVLLPLLVAANAVRIRGSLTAVRDWRATLLTHTDPADWFREPADPDLEDFRTRSGLILHVPARRNLCRRAPLPCTPHPAPNLVLRTPGELRRGFAIEGAWQPTRWPNPASRFLDPGTRPRGAGSFRP